MASARTIEPSPDPDVLTEPGVRGGCWQARDSDRLLQVHSRAQIAAWVTEQRLRH